MTDTHTDLTVGGGGWVRVLLDGLWRGDEGLVRAVGRGAGQAIAASHWTKGRNRTGNSQ